MKPDNPIPCPRCGSKEVHFSEMRLARDYLMQLLGKVPYRCRICRRRFYAHGDLQDQHSVSS